MAILAVLVSVHSLSAANIAWVSDANDPATGFYQSNPSLTDHQFVILLQNAGHNVVTYNPPPQGTSADFAALNTNDLVIINRCVLSGIFQADQAAQWNTLITKPLIDQSAYHARGSRLGWFTAAEGADDTPTVLSAVITGNPATDAVVDYLFGGVAMNGMNTAFPYDETADRNSTPIGAAVTGGIIYATATYVTEGSTAVPPVPVMANVIVGFPAGTAVRGGADILTGYRMFFAAGSREAVTAPNTVNLYAGRENLTATGEDIFLRAVQVALNNGLAPIDPNAPVAITSQPVSMTVGQGDSATFSISVTGAAPRVLQWQRDIGDGITFTNIPDGSTTFSISSYTLPAVSPDDNGARFRVEVSNPVNSVVSDVITLTVTPDTAPPVPLSALSLDGLTVSVCFDEVLENTDNTLLDPFSYTLNEGAGPAVSMITVRPDGRSLILTLDGPLESTFTITMAALYDRFGNQMPLEGVTLSGSNLGLSTAMVGSLDPAGAVFACDPGTIEISAGGLDLQSLGDQLQFLYQTVEGDFDVRVRVASLLGTPDHLETTAKAILTARQTTEASSPAVTVFVTPPYPGDGSFGAMARPSAGGETVSNFVAVPYGLNAIPATYPNAWMRLRRMGDSFTTFHSANGSDWSEIGTVEVVLGPSALVGIGAVSHRNGKPATGIFHDLQFGAMSVEPTLVNVAYTGGSFSAAFQTEGGTDYTVEYKDSLTATSWTTLTTINGDGTVQSFTDSGPVSPTGSRFYRVAVQ